MAWYCKQHGEVEPIEEEVETKKGKKKLVRKCPECSTYVSSEPLGERKKTITGIEAAYGPTFETIKRDEDKLYRILMDNDIGNSRTIVDMFFNVKDWKKLDDPRWLKECLEEGRVRGSKQRTVLSSWYGMRYSEIDKIFEEEEGLGKKEGIKVEKKSVDDMLDETLADEMKELKRLQMRKRIQELEQELRGAGRLEKPSESEKPKEPEKHVHYLDDGTTVEVTDKEWLEYNMAMERLKQKTAEKEATKKDELVDFPYEGQVIKIHQSQVPLYISMQKPKTDDSVRQLMDDLKAEKEARLRLEADQRDSRVLGAVEGLRDEIIKTKDEVEKVKQSASKSEIDAYVEMGSKIDKSLGPRGKKSLLEHDMEMERIDREKRLSMLEDKVSGMDKKTEILLRAVTPVIQKKVAKMVLEEGEMPPRRGRFMIPEKGYTEETKKLKRKTEEMKELKKLEETEGED